MSIYHIARKKPFGVHFPGARLFRLEDVRISQGLTDRCAIGRIGGEHYDPFAAYYETEERRDGPIPPHLEFSRLSGDEDDAKRFLERFGPLTTEGQISRRHDADQHLDLTWRESVRDTKERLKNPSEYYRRHSQFEPRIISPKSMVEAELVTVNLCEFWTEQEEFLFLALLIEAIRSERPAKEAKSLLLRFVKKPLKENFGAFVLTPEIYADFQIALGLKSPSHGEDLKKTLLSELEKRDAHEIVAVAARLVQLRVNSKLSEVCPFLASDPESPRREHPGFARTWLCRNLIGALYAMLFLDIEHHRRVVRCEGCGVLFQEIKENVIYCSPRCETRTRVRDWWRKHGKSYRAKQREKSKPAGKSVSERPVAPRTKGKRNRSGVPKGEGEQ